MSKDQEILDTAEQIRQDLDAADHATNIHLARTRVIGLALNNASVMSIMSLKGTPAEFGIQIPEEHLETMHESLDMAVRDLADLLGR